MANISNYVEACELLGVEHLFDPEKMMILGQGGGTDQDVALVLDNLEAVAAMAHALGLPGLATVNDEGPEERDRADTETLLATNPLSAALEGENVHLRGQVERLQLSLETQTRLKDDALRLLHEERQERQRLENELAEARQACDALKVWKKKKRTSPHTPKPLCSVLVCLFQCPIFIISAPRLK